MSWDSKLVNLNVLPKGSTLNVRKLPDTAQAILKTVKSGESAGRTTGSLIKFSPENTWYQIIFPDKKTLGYVRQDVIKLEAAQKDITDKEATDLINNLVKIDANIYETLMRASVIIQNLKNKGIDTSKYDATFKTIIDNIHNRQAKIKGSKLLKFQTGLKKTYQSIANTFKNYIQKTFGIAINGIGAVPIIGYVIAVGVGAGLAALVYYAFKPDYDQSTKDLKMTAELEKALKAVDPATAEKIKSQLEQQVDTAYNQGKTTGTFSGLFSFGKYIIIGVVGFFALNKLIQSQKNK